VALEELRITVFYPEHLVAILGEILPTLAKTSNLSRIVLDADGSAVGGEDVDQLAWNSVDAVMSEYAENRSTKYRKGRLALQFRTDKEGGTGEHDWWARELGGSLALFSKVGSVEYVPRR
jgi:hypothetical protein